MLVIAEELLTKCRETQRTPHVWIWKCVKRRPDARNWATRKKLFQSTKQNAQTRCSSSGLLVAHHRKGLTSEKNHSPKRTQRKRNSLGDISFVSCNQLSNDASPLSTLNRSSSQSSILHRKSADCEFSLMPQSDIGEFDEHRAYLCLQMQIVDWTVSATIPQPLSNVLFVNIHAWKGNECPNRLQKLLHQRSIQLEEYFSSFRERFLQEYNTELLVRVVHEQSRQETPQFKSYFQYFFYRQPNQEVINGSISFLREGRLLHIKGYSAHMSVREVPVRMDSLNHGDVFILEMEHNIFIWNGRESNQQEQHAAQHVAQHFHFLSKGRKPTKTIEDTEEHNSEFLALLPQNTGKIQSTEVGGEDVEVQPTLRLLYRIENTCSSSSRSLLSEASNTRYIFVARGRLYKDMLSDPRAVYMVDTGVDLLLWLGRSIDKNLRQDALQFSVRYLRLHSLSEKTCISIVREDSEDEYFRSQFHFWGTVKSDQQPKKNHEHSDAQK